MAVIKGWGLEQENSYLPIFCPSQIASGPSARNHPEVKEQTDRGPRNHMADDIRDVHLGEDSTNGDVIAVFRGTYLEGELDSWDRRQSQGLCG